MAYLVLMFIAIVLLLSFIFALEYEASHGVRFFAPRRAALDETVLRIRFIVTHVDLAAFLAEEARHIVTVAGHAIVAISLKAVRAAERLLTRMVRHLRTRTENAEVPHENAREFVKTLSDFKDTLKTSYPGAPEIE
jgi:hypothetical protein